MTALATAYASSVLTYLKGGGAPTSISAIYLDLFNGNPASGGTSQLSTITGSATRQNISSAMGSPSNFMMSNTTAIDIVTAALAGAYVDFIAIYDASTSGNLIMYSPLVNPQTVTLYNPCSFPIGSIQVQLF